MKKVEQKCLKGENTMKEQRDIIDITTKMEIWLTKKKGDKLTPKRRSKHIPIEKIMRSTKKQRRKQFRKPMPDSRCHNFHAINLMMTQSEDNPAWAEFFASHSRKIIDEFIECWDPEDQERLSALVDAARHNWECPTCKEFKIEDVTKGYIECDECERQYHKTCVEMEVLFYQFSFILFSQELSFRIQLSYLTQPISNLNFAG